MSDKAIFIGSRREVLWDTAHIDAGETTARLCVVPPTEKECVYVADAPWEGDCLIYLDCIADETGYKIYYKTCKTWEGEDVQLECLLVSKDGIRFERPSLGLYEYNGSTDNNILMRIEDNFSVFLDGNPACPAEERYKSVSQITEDGVSRLWCYTSADGIRFEKKGIVTEKGTFDSQNTCYYDTAAGRYVCYARGFHDDENEDLRANDKRTEQAVRDIRVLYSEDFKTWTDPVRIRFDDGEDIPLYTNVISVYERAPDRLIGFPVRYIGRRKEWTANYDRLGGPNRRKERMKINPRLGLAMNDCMFMSSRDGVNFHRFRKAFLTPGIETDTNWVYPNCYVSHGLVRTSPDAYSLYVNNEQWSFGKARLVRYESRIDGFACMESEEEEAVIVTKPLVYTGDSLRINFATSAFGYLYADLLDESGNVIPGTESVEMFGDNTNARVCFAEKSVIGKYEGQPVRLRFRLRDAKLYSFVFERERV